MPLGATAAPYIESADPSPPDLCGVQHWSDNSNPGWLCRSRESQFLLQYSQWLHVSEMRTCQAQKHRLTRNSLFDGQPDSKKRSKHCSHRLVPDNDANDKDRLP